MIKYYCDRCGTEIKELVAAGKIYLNNMNASKDEMLICPDCRNSFFIWQVEKTERSEKNE